VDASAAFAEDPIRDGPDRQTLDVKDLGPYDVDVRWVLETRLHANIVDSSKY
jgi:hypothetical protein